MKSPPAPLEAAGLRWLAEAGARVPEIVGESENRLVLRRIPPGRLDAAGEEELGRMLATVHSAGAPHFGSLPAPGPFFVGPLGMASPGSDDWCEYYLRSRLLVTSGRATSWRTVTGARG